MMLFLLGLPSRVLPLNDASAVNVTDVPKEVALGHRLAGLGAMPLNQGPMVVFPVLSYIVMDSPDRMAAELNQSVGQRVAPIFLDGNAAHLTSLKPGMKVVLQLKTDNQVVGNKGVERVHASGTGNAPTEATGTLGVIKAVDASEKTLTVTVTEGGQEKDETFDLEAPSYLQFLKLENLAINSFERDQYRGKKIQVEGQFVPYPGTDRVFSLARYKIQCCAADAVQLNVPIICRESLQSFNREDWVRVTGRVEFHEAPNRPGVYQTIIIVNRKANVVKTLPDSNPYVR
jgi:uncharacterized membrane protein YcgQ (UPF0703/DUF1980 family)